MGSAGRATAVLASVTMARAVHDRIRLSTKGATNQRHGRQPNFTFVIGVFAYFHATATAARTNTAARVVTQLGVAEWTVTQNV